MKTLWPRRIVDVRPGETRVLVLSFLTFFFLLTSYYILRPLRDERAIAGGVAALPWLFSTTFLVMLVVVPLWSALLSRVSRRRIVPLVYRFFLLNLAAFAVLLRIPGAEVVSARAFFVWTSVFNYLAVSVFWSFMADIFRQEQGRRLFGFIAAGGSAGAILGPLATGLLVERLWLANLLLLSAALLEAAARCVRALARSRPQAADREAMAVDEQPVGGGAFSGARILLTSPYLLGICAYTLLVALSATFGYFLQAHLVSAAGMSPVERTILFARMDFAVNAGSALLQVLVTGRLLARGGVRWGLALAPPLSTLAFLALAAAPTVAASSALQVLRRVLGFGIVNPALQLLYTVVGQEEKYKSKAFIDTVIARGGDAVNAWLVTGLLGAGLGVSGAALATAPLGVLWLAVALFVDRRHRRLAAARPDGPPA